MLATLIPLFNDNSEVRAYSLATQKENKLLSPLYMGTAAFDGAVRVNGLEVIDNIGLENLSGERKVFVELTQFSVFSEIETDCKVSFDRVVFLIDTTIKPREDYINRITQLKSKGFRFALKKLGLQDFAAYNEILKLMDYFFVDHKKINVQKAKEIFGKAYPELKLVAVNVDTKEEYESLASHGRFDLYEGHFFRMPVTSGDTELSPLKISYLELLKVVNTPDFDITDAADVIGHDTALVVELLKMANRMSVNSEITSIRHAAAMIGQKELKKWINSAVTKELCSDKPNEITRISLIRARFAENLAPFFDLAMKDQELFLMGLFSVLDVILDKPMEEALSMIVVSKEIQQALVEKKGELAPVLDFVIEYEDASWQEISRLIIMNDMDMDMVYKAYVDALAWFKNLFS